MVSISKNRISKILSVFLILAMGLQGPVSIGFAQDPDDQTSSPLAPSTDIPFTGPIPADQPDPTPAWADPALAAFVPVPMPAAAPPPAPAAPVPPPAPAAVPPPPPAVEFWQDPNNTQHTRTVNRTYEFRNGDWVIKTENISEVEPSSENTMVNMTPLSETDGNPVAAIQTKLVTKMLNKTFGLSDPNDPNSNWVIKTAMGTKTIHTEKYLPSPSEEAAAVPVEISNDFYEYFLPQNGVVIGERLMRKDLRVSAIFDGTQPGGPSETTHTDMFVTAIHNGAAAPQSLTGHQNVVTTEKSQANGVATTIVTTKHVMFSGIDTAADHELETISEVRTVLNEPQKVVYDKIDITRREFKRGVYNPPTDSWGVFVAYHNLDELERTPDAAVVVKDARKYEEFEGTQRTVYYERKTTYQPNGAPKDFIRWNGNPASPQDFKIVWQNNVPAATQNGNAVANAAAQQTYAMIPGEEMNLMRTPGGPTAFPPFVAPPPPVIVAAPPVSVPPPAVAPPVVPPATAVAAVTPPPASTVLAMTAPLPPPSPLPAAPTGIVAAPTVPPPPPASVPVEPPAPTVLAAAAPLPSALAALPPPAPVTLPPPTTALAGFTTPPAPMPPPAPVDLNPQVYAAPPPQNALPPAVAPFAAMPGVAVNGETLDDWKERIKITYPTAKFEEMTETVPFGNLAVPLPALALLNWQVKNPGKMGLEARFSSSLNVNNVPSSITYVIAYLEAPNAIPQPVPPAPAAPMPAAPTAAVVPGPTGFPGLTEEQRETLARIEEMAGRIAGQAEFCLATGPVCLDYAFVLMALINQVLDSEEAQGLHAYLVRLEYDTDDGRVGHALVAVTVERNGVLEVYLVEAKTGKVVMFWTQPAGTVPVLSPEDAERYGREIATVGQSGESAGGRNVGDIRIGDDFAVGLSDLLRILGQEPWQYFPESYYPRDYSKDEWQIGPSDPFEIKIFPSLMGVPPNPAPAPVPAPMLPLAPMPAGDIQPPPVPVAPPPVVNPAPPPMPVPVVPAPLSAAPAPAPMPPPAPIPAVPLPAPAPLTPPAVVITPPATVDLNPQVYAVAAPQNPMVGEKISPDEFAPAINYAALDEWKEGVKAKHPLVKFEETKEGVSLGSLAAPLPAIALLNWQVKHADKTAVDAYYHHSEIADGQVTAIVYVIAYLDVPAAAASAPMPPPAPIPAVPSPAAALSAPIAPPPPASVPVLAAPPLPSAPPLQFPSENSTASAEAPSALEPYPAPVPGPVLAASPPLAQTPPTNDSTLPPGTTPYPEFPMPFDPAGLDPTEELNMIPPPVASDDVWGEFGYAEEVMQPFVATLPPPAEDDITQFADAPPQQAPAPLSPEERAEQARVALLQFDRFADVLRGIPDLDRDPNALRAVNTFLTETRLGLAGNPDQAIQFGRYYDPAVYPVLDALRNIGNRDARNIAIHHIGLPAFNQIRRAVSLSAATTLAQRYAPAITQFSVTATALLNVVTSDTSAGPVTGFLRGLGARITANSVEAVRFTQNLPLLGDVIAALGAIEDTGIRDIAIMHFVPTFYQILDPRSADLRNAAKQRIAASITRFSETATALRAISVDPDTFSFVTNQLMRLAMRWSNPSEAARFNQNTPALTSVITALADIPNGAGRNTTIRYVLPAFYRVLGAASLPAANTLAASYVPAVGKFADVATALLRISPAEGTARDAVTETLTTLAGWMLANPTQTSRFVRRAPSLLRLITAVGNIDDTSRRNRAISTYLRFSGPRDGYPFSHILRSDITDERATQLATGYVRAIGLFR